MSMTHERKVLAAVLGLGLTALAVDRLMLGGASNPAAADAGIPVEAAAYAVPTAGVPAERLPAIETNLDQSIAHRLRDLAVRRGFTADHVREAFVPAESWVPRTPADDEVETSVTPAVDVGAGFKAAHTLSAIMGSGPTAVAIVDDRPIRIGDRIDGHVLVGVEARSAMFESPAGSVELTLAAP